MKRLAIFLIMLFSAAAFAQPQIAVHVSGNIPDSEKNALGRIMLDLLVNSGRYSYMGVERSNSFRAEVEQAVRQNGAIDDRRISELGRQSGVKFVCVVDIAPANDYVQVSARIVDVETASAVFMGASSSGLLDSAAELQALLDKLVENMFGGKAAPEREITSRNANNDEAVKKTADKVNRNMTRNIILGVVGAGLYIVFYVCVILAAANS